MIPAPKPDHQVLWNGVNDGRDGDLLFDDRRIADKTYPGADRRSEVLAHERDAVVDGLQRLGPVRLTVLATALKLPQSRVTGVLYYLRRHGHLRERASNVANNRPGNLLGFEREYWLPARWRLTG